MKSIYEGKYIIEAADTAEKYEKLRTLWCDVFGDPPELVDAVYRAFGADPDNGSFEAGDSSDIRGFIITDTCGRACASLSCYRCGSFEEKPVYVSYAVCTAEDRRGIGLASALTECVRDEVLSEGGLSIVSPADRSLEKFYNRLGYAPYFHAAEQTVISPELDTDIFDDFDEFDMDFGDGGSGIAAAELTADMQRISPGEYNSYREAFLRGHRDLYRNGELPYPSGRPHIELSENMLRLIEGWCEGLYLVNRGDAVCAVSETVSGRIMIDELLVNPALLELSSDIEAEIAGLAAKHFDASEAVYRVPGRGSCQSMAAGLSPEITAEAGKEGGEDENGYMRREAYYGFPLD